MAKKAVVQCLSRLAEKEAKLSSAVAPPDMKQVAEIEWEPLVQRLLWWQDGGGNSRIRPGAWGTAVEHIPLSYQLLLYPTLIVNLHPYTDSEDFQKRYRMSQEQMLQLLDLGTILLNVFAYDSDSRSGFERYGASPGIERLLEHPGCRINSVRRNFFLQAVDPTGAGAKDALTKAQRLFWSAIDEMDPEQRLALTDTFRYLHVLGKHDDRLSKWIVSLGEEELTAARAKPIITELRGLKARIAAGFTAAFGGFMSFGETLWLKWPKLRRT
jgi:hypothetical protein